MKKGRSVKDNGKRSLQEVDKDKLRRGMKRKKKREAREIVFGVARRRMRGRARRG